MAAIVVVDAHEGSLTRYETGGETARKTHACTQGYACTFTPAIVESFRRFPPDEFSIDPSPQPTGPRGGVGFVSISEAA